MLLLMFWPRSAGRHSEKSHLAPAALGEHLVTFTSSLIPFTLLLSNVLDLNMSRHSSAGPQATEVCEYPRQIIGFPFVCGT